MASHARIGYPLTLTILEVLNTVLPDELFCNADIQWFGFTGPMSHTNQHLLRPRTAYSAWYFAF